MKKRNVSIIISLILIVLFSLSKFSQQAKFSLPLKLSNTNESYFVRNVMDGDTIELSNGEKVRYIGIDTPEIRRKEGSKWVYDPMPYAEAAMEFNRKLVRGERVRLEFDAQKKDKYNRLLAYVYSGNKMVNIEMVKEGFAMLYTYPPNVKYVDKFIAAQKEARENKRGIWRDLLLGDSKISTKEARENIGKMRVIDGIVIDTYLTDKMLVLKFRDNFKVVIFRDNLQSFPKAMSRSPDTYLKGKTVRVHGIIKKYKNSPEIVIHDASQLEIL